MVASTDLHQQPQAQHSPHTSPWGTWEELLLASAVQRYGQDNWALISAELQSRTKSSFTFTPEACQSKYEAIKLRFGFTGSREEGDGTVWFEELRKLRVAQLKCELEQYDSSIGSLEKKIRNLQSERTEINSQKSLSVEYGAIELERDQYDACKPGSHVGLVGTDIFGSHKHSGSMKKSSAKIKENAKGKSRVPGTRTHVKAIGASMSIASLASDKRVRVLEAYGESQAKIGLESGKIECSGPNAFKTKLSSLSEREHATAAGVSCELLVDKVKAEMLNAEEKLSVYKMDGGMQTLASRELAIMNPQPSKREVKDLGDNSEGRISKLSQLVIEGSDEKRDASVPFALAIIVKAESVLTINEVSNSAEASRSPGGNNDSMESWLHLERLSGDSKLENAELGSQLDVYEDVSPSSKTNREPEVCEKLLPLLVSLRNVSAHRCAPLFEHQRESQSNRRYHLMIRAPMDLGMIRVKLEDSHYCGSLDFFRDLLLMVTNALVYYSKDSSESAAASGLRECIMREMESIAKTELLIKQGLTFRKQDMGKARQRSPAKGVGAQIALPSVVDEPLTGVGSTVCDAIFHVGGVDDQSNAKEPAGEGATLTEEKDESSLDAKRLIDSKSIKSKSVTSRKTLEAIKVSLADEDWRKTPAGTTRISSTTKGPLKRGVGRPPKHTHDQDSPKAKEASISRSG